jgi:PAS domain S-box-containing protein
VTSLGLETPLLFAAHLFSLLVAVAAGLALARERDRSLPARATGTIGFLALASAEALHGSGFGGDAGTVPVLLRSAGYVLLVAAALPAARGASPAAVALPGGVLVPAAAGMAAGLATGWRRRGERGGLWLAGGLLLLGAAEAVLRFQAGWTEAATHGLRVAGYLAVARFVVALTRHSLRFRLLVGFASLLIVVVLIVSSAVGTVLDRNLRADALDRAQAQAEDATAEFERRIGGQAVGLSVIGLLYADELRRNQPIPSGELAAYAERYLAEVDFLLLLDARGRVAIQLGLRGSDTLRLAGSDVVRFAVRENETAASLDTVGDSQLAFIGANPLELTPGRVAGYAVAGFFVDRDLLDRVVLGTENVVAAFRGSDPRPVARAGFPRSAPRRLLPSQLLREASEGFLFGAGSETRTLAIGGTSYYAALVPLRTEAGNLVGVLMVAEPATRVAATQRQVNQVLFLATVGVVGLAFLAALFAARRITRSLERLTGAARRVQAGDLGARADVRGEDEVADLADAFNRMTESVTVMTDELREAATEQSELRARLETVLNSMGDGLIAVNEREEVATYNPAAGTILGLSRSKVLGKPLREVLRGRDAEGRPLGTKRSLPTGLAFIRNEEGHEVPVAISSSLLRDAEGETLGRVLVFRDMTREHEVERMKTEFLSNVSHELRTPLTPIVGYSEILSRRDLPVTKTKEFASGILESARRLERIVAMLVDFSVIEAGRMAPSLEPTALRPVIQEAVDRWKERAGKHRFVTRIDPQIPAAQVDISLIQRILDELLDNAVKYSPEGGRVEVALTSENSSKRRMLRVDVSDQGIGIESEDLARIFQDFSQVDASDTRTFGGLGLGLTFVKRVVEAQGGEVTAVSEPGAGSTFSITLPAADTDGGRER